jgi:hypothetical protein
MLCRRNVTFQHHPAGLIVSSVFTLMRRAVSAVAKAVLDSQWRMVGNAHYWQTGSSVVRALAELSLLEFEMERSNHVPILSLPRSLV